MNQFLKKHQLNKTKVDETDELISVLMSGLQHTFLYSFPLSSLDLAIDMTVSQSAQQGILRPSTALKWQKSCLYS